MNFSYSNKKLAAVLTSIVVIAASFHYLTPEAATAISGGIAAILAAFDGHAEVPK